MVKWVFCDLDGTLIDSMAMLRDTYEGILAARGRLGSDEEFNSLIGLALPEIVDKLRENYQLDEPVPFLLSDYESRIIHAYKRVSPCRGATSLIAGLTSLGCKLGVVTSATRVMVNHVLEHLHWESYFLVTVAGDEVDSSKPAADSYRLALAHAACRPEFAVAIEDSDSGTKAARAAGITVLGVHNSFQPKPGLVPVGDLFGALSWIMAAR